MNVRKTIAGALLAGTIAIAGAGVAGAATTQTPPASSGSHEAYCEVMQLRLDSMHARLDFINGRIAEATQVRGTLKSQGHDKAAQKLSDRIAKAQQRVQDVEQRLDKVQDKTNEYCSGTASSSSS